MEVFEDRENKRSVLNLEDFPFICRICLKRGDLRLFEDEDYLLDLFETITKIDVRSTVDAPKNVCIECINILEDTSLFIDISKYNDARQGQNLIPTKDNEYGEALETNEGSEICRICLLKGCLTPFEEKTYLMELFTNIDVQVESKFSRRHSICNKCADELGKISIFLTFIIVQ